MAYANSLPETLIRACRWFNKGCLLLTILICLDIFILPRTIQTEKIISRELQFVTTRARYSNHAHRTQLENEILTTKNFRYLYYKKQNFSPQGADSVRFVATSLFNIVETGYIKSGGEEKALKPGTGIFGHLQFIPIIFALVAVFGVVMRSNKEQLLNAAVFNLMLIVAQLFVMDYVDIQFLLRE